MTWETWMAEKVKQARLEAGFASVEKLARAIGVSLNAAYRWEWAKTCPSSKHLAMIAKATNKPIEWFFPTELDEGFTTGKLRRALAA